MEHEDFQNEVIRPIIKMKNDFILVFFQTYIQSKKIVFESETEKRNKIESLLKSDLYLKNIYLGAIISQFDNSQLIEFFENKGEYSRRIINIIAKRIFDNL